MHEAKRRLCRVSPDAVLPKGDPPGVEKMGKVAFGRFEPAL
jgi:hypothetical protein